MRRILSGRFFRVSVCLILAVVVFSLFAGCGGAKKETFPSRNIKWIVPYGAGGGFDAYSRGLANYMPKHLGGKVGITVENIKAAQGVAGLSAMYTAKPDGYTLGILPMPTGVVQEIRLGADVKFVTEKFTVLGSADENAYVVYTAAKGPYQTIQDLIKKKDVKSLTASMGSSSGLANVLTAKVLDLNATIATGSDSSKDAAVAMMRGDVDYIVYGTTDIPQFIESGDVKAVLFLGTPEQREGFPWLEGVPGAEDIGIPEMAGAVTEARLIVSSPGVPADIAKILEDALWATLQDEEFLTWAKEAKRQIVPRNAEQARGIIETQSKLMKEIVPGLIKEGRLE